MKRFILVALATFSLFSCNNDLEIYTDPVDLPYVYGVVTTNKTEHYVKVTKTFQKLAKDVVFDDLYYHDDSIKVFIDEYTSGTKTGEFEGLPVLINDKDSGEFVFPENKYYKFTNSLLRGPKAFNTNTLKTYKVRVELNSGKTIISNKEFLTLNASVSLKTPVKNDIDNGNVAVSFVNDAGILVPELFEWEQEGGGKESGVINIFIKEKNYLTGEVDTLVVPINFYNELPTTEKVVATLELSDLYTQLPVLLKKSPDLYRELLNVVVDNKVVKGYGVGLDIWSASKDYTTYETILFNQTGISQDKPNFTNLENGLGLFTSRSNRSIPAQDNSIYFAKDVLDSLACSSYFFDYNFTRHRVDNSGNLENLIEANRCSK